MKYTKRDKQIILEFLKKTKLLPIWINYIYDENCGLPSNHLEAKNLKDLEKYSKNITHYFGHTLFTNYVYKKTKRRPNYSVHEYFSKFLHDNYYEEYYDKCKKEYAFINPRINSKLF